MSDFQIPHLNEQILVSRALVLAAKNASEGMDKFIHWMLAGFAAGLTYLLGQSHIPFISLKPIASLFLIAALIGILQRYLAMIVSIGATTFQEGEKLHDNRTPIDIARFFIIYIQSLPVTNRWAAAWAARQFMTGNLTATGKGIMNFAIIQCTLGLACTALLLVGFYQVISSIGTALPQVHP
jgi:hypothetical protein